VATLNRSHLLAVDIDSPPGDVEYNVIRSPAQGKVVRTRVYNATRIMEPTESFTQADLDSGDILFVQNSNTDGVYPGMACVH